MKQAASRPRPPLPSAASGSSVGDHVEIDAERGRAPRASRPSGRYWRRRRASAGRSGIRATDNRRACPAGRRLPWSNSIHWSMMRSRTTWIAAVSQSCGVATVASLPTRYFRASGFRRRAFRDRMFPESALGASDVSHARHVASKSLPADRKASKSAASSRCNANRFRELSQSINGIRAILFACATPARSRCPRSPAASWRRS